jgi:DNA-binding NarL/FixJ family response regulator
MGRLSEGAKSFAVLFSVDNGANLRSMPQPLQQPAPDAPLPEGIPQSGRILVVDDSEAVRDVIRTFLEKAGFQICGEATDGVEGLAKAQELKPNLVVLDLSMPGMSGVEAASALRQAMPNVPIVILTMYGDVLGQAMAVGLGVTAVVAKADGMVKLVECIRRVLAPSVDVVLPQKRAASNAPTSM